MKAGECDKVRLGAGAASCRGEPPSSHPCPPRSGSQHADPYLPALPPSPPSAPSPPPLQVCAAFDHMLAQGLSPSIVTYNTLLASCAHRGAWGKALEALTHVLAAQPEGVNPNTGGSRGGQGRALEGGLAQAGRQAGLTDGRSSSADGSTQPASRIPPPPSRHPPCSHLQLVPGGTGQGRGERAPPAGAPAGLARAAGVWPDAGHGRLRPHRRLLRLAHRGPARHGAAPAGKCGQVRGLHVQRSTLAALQLLPAPPPACLPTFRSASPTSLPLSTRTHHPQRRWWRRTRACWAQGSPPTRPPPVSS